MDKQLVGTKWCLMKISRGDCNLEYRHVVTVQGGGADHGMRR
jgi:hypothetical protein